MSAYLEYLVEEWIRDETSKVDIGMKLRKYILNHQYQSNIARCQAEVKEFTLDLDKRWKNLQAEFAKLRIRFVFSTALGNYESPRTLLVANFLIPIPRVKAFTGLASH